MKLSSECHYLANQFGLHAAVNMMADAGYDAIDYSAFEEEWYSDARDKTFYTDARKIAEDRGLTFNQAHAPFPSSFGDPEKDKKTFENIVSSMKIASWLGVKNIIVHPCQHMEYAANGVPEKLFDINMDFYRRLIPYCEEYNIRVAVENMWQYPRTVSHSTCSKPDEFVRYMDSLNSEWLVACLDVGHAMLVKEKPGDMVRALGRKHLQALHVHDIDGVHDTHTLPYSGIIDWQAFMESLAEIDYQGDLTFEADCFFSHTPPALWKDSIKYMVSVGRYLISLFEAAKNK
ncbi:MAG: sugar phosphate isomerase/epimerase [Clostridia bacterium]|nr:sugar phosphate isomerase/epimerase [Clostridia bacterium]